MRLIDADALVNVVETARKKARTLTGMDFVMVTKTQPTIDAIPVEWIFEQMQILHELHNKNEYVLQWLMELWKKEQEAQDG